MVAQVNNRLKVKCIKTKSDIIIAFLLYYKVMIKGVEKLGAFIVPTGVGASIGGYAGDASTWARKFSTVSKLIVNPNVVNAGCFSGITEDMLYVEGYSLDEFFKGNLTLKPSKYNKIGIVFDKAIPEDVLNVHINTINAVKCVYGIDIAAYRITNKEVGVVFNVENNGISTGNVKNIGTLKDCANSLIREDKCDAIGIVCLFEDPEGINEGYCEGIGVDPVGGVEAILSHYISKELKIPTAHSPAFSDYQIYPQLVDGKAASEYITPTFLPCILFGLDIAPLLGKNYDISINNLDYLIMPYNSLGSTPVFECLKRNIPIFAIKENKTVLNVSNDNLFKSDKIMIFNTYSDCFEYVKNTKF